MFSRTCSIIDAPSDLGLRPTGVDGLPDALRAVGLLERLPNAQSAGRLPVPPYNPRPDPSTGVLNVQSIKQFSLQLADRIALVLDRSQFPIVLGGDCSVLLGSMLALHRRGRYGLLFIDGHADFYSPESEPRGEVASMELAIATGREPAVLAKLDGELPLVREEDVVLFGYRDADVAAENGSPDVRATSMGAYDLWAVRDAGITAIAEKAVDKFEGSGVEGFWIHLDADVLNDQVMPAVDYRMPDGLWPGELSSAMAVMLSSPLVAGLEVTIYNPAFDDRENSAARVLVRSITDAFAAST